MTRLEASLTQGASAGRRVARSAFVQVTLTLALASLTACPGSTMDNPDMAHPTDGGGDGGSMKVQKPGCTLEDWCWLFPEPQGNTLWSVWGSSSSDAWAVGDSGTLLHYSGGQWKSVVSPTKNPLNGIWGASASDIYAVGDRATVLHYDGQTWSPYTISGTTTGIGSLYGIWGTGTDDIWMVGTGGVVLHKSGGSLTRAQTPNMPAFQVLLRGVWGTGGIVYAVGAAGTVLKYDGTNWTASVISGASSEILTAIAGTSATNIFVASLSGSIRVGDGTNFSQLDVCGSACKFGRFGLYGVWALGSDVYTVGDIDYPLNAMTGTRDPTMRKGTLKKWNGSTSFDDVMNAPPVTYYGVWGTSGSDVYAVGASGSIVHYNGTSFSSSSIADQLTGVSAPLVGISGTASDNLYAVGDWGTTLKWNGTQWNSLPSSAYIRFRALAGTSDNLWSLGYDSTPMVSTPHIFNLQGTTWQKVSPDPSNVDLLGLWISGSDGVAVGPNDTVLRRNGASWNIVTVNSPNGTALRGAWGADTSNIWIVGGGDYLNENQSTYPGKILLYNGSSANPVANLPTMNTLHSVWGSARDHVFAVGDAGTVLTWDGTSWTKQLSNTPFALYGVWGNSATDVYATGAGGTLLHFDGQVWTRQETGTTITLNKVWGAGKDIFLAGFSGTVLHKTTP